jgi:hypothetical protein
MDHRTGGRRTALWVGLWVVVVALLVAGIPASGPSAGNTSRTNGGLGVAATPGLTPPLTVSIFVGPNPVSQGSQFSVSATVSGGVSPYSYNWPVVPPGCSPPGNSQGWQCTLSQTGSYSIQVQVTDQNGTQVSNSQSVTVNSNSGGGGGGGNGNKSNNNGSGFNLSGFGPFLTYALIGAIVSFGLLVALTVGVLMIAVILARRLPKPVKGRGAMVCKTCQATAAADAKFCPACGTPFPAEK